MRRRFGAFHLLLSAGWGLALVAGVPAAGENRWRTLASAIEELAKAESDLIEARDLDGRVAPWARYQPDWARAEPPPDPAGLRRLIDTSGDAQGKALSCLWLAVLDDPQDLDRVGALLESPLQAGALPQVVEQIKAGDLDVAWRPITLGFAARLAMRRMAGVDLIDRRAFARWRNLNPDPTRSLKWWKARYDGSSEAGRAAVLADVRSRNPLMFARLVMQVIPPRGDKLTEAQVRLNADAAGVLEAVLGLQGLKAVLTDRIDWEELRSGDLVVKTKQWVLLQWTRILGTREARSLAELWFARASVEPRFVHPELALALAEVRPDEASEVLQKMLIELPRTEVADALRHLARVIPVPQAWSLHYWFYGPDGPDSDVNRVGILQGLRERGIPGGRDVLRALIKLWSFKTDSPLFVTELVKTVRALGCRARFPRLGEIGPVPEPSRTARDAEYARAAALVKKAAEARKDTVTRVRLWLRPDMPP